MTHRLDTRTTGLAALGLAGVAAVILHLLSPPPLADTRRGSETGFATRGLQARAIEGGVLARRWAGAALALAFVNLPGGPLDLEIEVRSQRHPVAVSLEGAVLGTILPAAGPFRVRLAEARRHRLDLTLTAQTFEARGGRQLGFLFERALVRPSPPGLLPPLPLFLSLLLPAAAALGVARWLGLGPVIALALVALMEGVLFALLLPYGLARSPYSRELCGWLALGLGLLGLLARRVALVLAGSSPSDRSAFERWGFAALLPAFLIQGIAAAHPCLVASDAVFHAHNLQAVANGDFWLTSLTPHDPPFRFPYGVSFYALLVPLLHTGFDLTTLVRFLASASAVVAAMALFAFLAPLGPRRAALAVGLLQAMPVTFDLLSAGNYTNVFAQSVTLIFLAWWAGKTPGGPVVGGLLLLVAATAHFGALLFVLVLCVALVIAAGRPDRARAWALLWGLGLTAAYYGQFLGLMIGQAERLLGGGRGGGSGIAVGLLTQLGDATREWGWPVLLLAVLGLLTRRARWRGERGEIAALGLAGVPFVLAAAVSPLEVRYLYAVAPAVAVLAAFGLGAIREAGPSGPVRRLGRLAMGLLTLAQAWLLLQGVARALFERYRA